MKVIPSSYFVLRIRIFGKRANEIKAYRKQLLPMLPVSKRGRTVVVLVVGAERAVAVLLFNVVCLFLGAWLVVGMCAAALSWQ